MRQRYDAFGLIFEFPFRCPDLRPAAFALRPDITVHLSPVPEELPETCYRESYPGYSCQIGKTQFLLKIDGIGCFLVEDGNRILLSTYPGVHRDDVLAYLLGSCIGVLLHQRSVLPLHASAISTEKGAVLFAGHSGTGKSTLLAAFQQRGYGVLADDVSAVREDEQQGFSVAPAFPRIKLAADSAAKLSLETHEWGRVGVESQKFSIPVGASQSIQDTSLRGIYVLTPSHQADISVEILTGSHRLAAIIEHTYRREWIAGRERSETHFRSAVAVASQVPVMRVYRPHEVFLLDELVNCLQKDLQQRAAGD